MIGAEVRYTRLGYWMRQAPYGYISEKVETRNGKRTILKPHPKEAPLLRKLFEIRALGAYTDTEICAQLNALGFKTRTRYKRSKHDRTRIISKTGGDPLGPKALWKIIRHPIYAGINVEKWTEGKPVKCAFEGLVSIELFNRANKGKVTLVENGDDIEFLTKDSERVIVNAGVRSPDFPYKRFVGCSKCGRPLLGSASRGKNGKYYPAYHCSNHGHYFRVPKDELEATVTEFISLIKPSQEQITMLTDAVLAEWEKRQQHTEKVLENYNERIVDLKAELRQTLQSMKSLTSATAIKYMEEDLMHIETQIQQLESDKKAIAGVDMSKIERIVSRVKFFLENMDKLMLKQIDPVKKAQFFGVLFDRIPRYSEINSGTPSLLPLDLCFEATKKTQESLESLVVNSKGVNFETFYHELEELSDKLAAMEDQNV